MINRIRHGLAWLLTLALLLAGTRTLSAQTTGIRTLTGTYSTTNPIYPLIGATPGIVLYDFAGLVHQDFDFQPSLSSQTLGTLEGDITQGRYTIRLPEAPQGELLDLDGNPHTPPVQLFVPALFIDFLGDAYLNPGEMPMNTSAQIAPLSFEIGGGYVLVWASETGATFPRSVGPDGELFTADDPQMVLPAGWSAVSLDGDIFDLIHEPTVEMPLLENTGQLNDYSDLSYTEAWERLFARARLTYPFTAEKGIDWDAIYREVTPLVDAASTTLDFHLAIVHFGGLIPDSHIGYVSLPVVQQFLMGGVGVSRLSVTDAGAVVVTDVEPDLPAWNAGLRAGAVLLQVDGQDALQALDETPMLLTSASTPQNRRYIQAALLLQGPLGSQVTLTWSDRGSNAQQEATLTREMDMSALLRMAGTELVSGDPVQGKMLPSGLGYIRVTSFASQVSQAEHEFAATLQELQNAGARGIILDLRSNSGGLVELAMAMAGHFFADAPRLADFYYADGAGTFAYRGHIEILPQQPYYDGPVAVLVDAMTGSAGDLFVYAMTQHDRAIVVGNTPTGGFTGEVSDGQYKLPGGLNLQMPTGRPVDPQSGATVLEGVGVVPNVRVPMTWETLVLQPDAVLSAAEKALR